MFEDQLGWILRDFKQGHINYAEATLQIEQLFMRQIGFSSYIYWFAQQAKVSENA